jgi:hypothetical protein
MVWEVGKMVVRGGIHVFVNNRKINLLSSKITADKLLKLAGYIEGEHWDLYRLQNELDPTGGTIVGATEILSIKDGDWFRVIGGHHTKE